MVDFLDPKALRFRHQKNAGYRTRISASGHLGGSRDVTDGAEVAAYGYDEHAGTYESPEPDPISRPRIGSVAERQIQALAATAILVDKTLDFLRRNNNQPCFVISGSTTFIPLGSQCGNPKEKNPNIAKNLKAGGRRMDRQIGRLMTD